MLRILQSFFWWFGRHLLGLRYHVKLIGLDKLGALQGPTLVMPNHPGLIDPPLVMCFVGSRGRVRPTVTEGMYRNPILYPFMRFVEALEVPDLGEQSRGARDQTLAMIDSIVAGVERGESFLIYPSGRTQRNGREVVGASRAVAEILERCPQVNIVMVRTQGLWGSFFSRAQTGKSPELVRCLLRGLGWFLANLLLFTPRRDVTITVQRVDRKDFPGLTRDKLNPYLENWYNEGMSETPVFVPYHFLFGPRSFEFPRIGSGGMVDVELIGPAAIAAVNEMIEEHLRRPLSDAEKQPQVALDQIGLDSLDRMDIALEIEDRFGFRSDHVAETIGQMWALATGQADRSETDLAPVPEAWHRPPSTMDVGVLAETIAEAFVRRFLLHPDDVVVADDLSGALSYRKLLVGARLLGKRLGRLPGRNVGVMLPASVAADLVFVALHLEGKLPAMMNWTTGPANLAHAVGQLGIRSVVTSRKLVDRLGIRIEGAEYIYLEDLKSQIGKLEAVAAMLSTYVLPRRQLARLPHVEVDDPAVVLFTSGSESQPKAVPLSHGNLITNLRAGVAVFGATRKDTLLAFLPPFHSFGMLGNVVLPLLMGVRAVHHPDPTAARELVRTAARYQASLAFSTPTFLGYMLGVATRDDLRSLRLIASGAEKCPQAVFDKAHQLAPQATILEGYGITECSPVVAGNRPGHIKPGTVGLPVDDVEVCVIDPESKQKLPPNTTGMLLVHGPSVFHGYLAYDGPEPFIEMDGKRWYVTGDLVALDEDGYITFRGRLKRFLKVGGEMVSLPALEEPLAQLYPPTENGPRVAVEGVETPGGRTIVLFTTEDLTLREANTLLAEAGMRGVMRLDEVVRMDAIPALGTGKTDYKVLRKMVVEKVQSAIAPSPSGRGSG
jgi:acyl-CoA synthetase (AMP-forming)/AMP-acid ligase II/1-acyl-sn-glycerol-3-phosphate acyltransferase/acyl carrier protein